METNIISEAYEYQREAIENLCLMDKERTKFYSTLVVVPTGGGKTRIAVDYLRENVFNKGGKVLWLGERLRLLTQTYEKFQENKRGKKLAVKKFSSKDENYQNTRIEQDTDLIIITQQTLRAQLVYNEYKEYDNLKGWFKKDDTLTVIIDEAHHATGIAYQNILYKLKQLHRKKVFKNLHIVGLTATPKMRDDESKIEETFFHGVKTDAKGQKRVSSETSYAYEISIHNLVVNQVLSRPYLIHIKENGKNEFEKEDLMNKKILSVYKNGLRGVKVESQLPESKKDKEQRSKEFGQTIIFVESRIQALKLEKLFKDNGVESCGLAISIDKQLGDKAEKAGLKAYYQKKIEKPEKDLEDYTKGKLNVIISVDKLREGIDIPKTQTVFIANKKVNEIQYTQMVGRALRGSIAGGTLIAYIVTFGDDDFEKMLWEIPDSYLDKKDEVKKKKYLGERKDKDISPIVLVNEDKIDIKGKKEKLKHFKHATEERKVEKEEEEVEKAVIREILMKFGTEKSIPKGYYQFNRKYLLVWDEMESWISYVCKNIDKITNDKGVNKLLDGGKSYKNFKIKAKGIYGEGSELARKRGILSSESVRCEYLYQFWHFYRVVENGDKELFDKDLKYKSFKSLKKYRIQEILEKGIKYSNEEAIKIFLEQEWNNFGEEREELWINSEIFASYFLPRIKWLNDIIVEPEIEEEDNEEDDYFRVKLYREGRKRKSLCELLKDVIRLGDISDEKKSSKFVDVFGGTGTVTAQMNGMFEERCYNDYDVVLANFVYWASNHSKFAEGVTKFLNNLDGYLRNETIIEGKIIVDDEIEKLQEIFSEDFKKELETEVNTALNLKGDDKNDKVKQKIESIERNINKKKTEFDEATDKKELRAKRKYFARRYKELLILKHMLDDDNDEQIANYTRVYLALYCKFNEELKKISKDENKQEDTSETEQKKTDENEETSLRDLINDDELLSNKELKYLELAYKFLFSRSFRSMKVSGTYATGVDPNGILEFLRMINKPKNWLYEYQERMDGVTVTSKDFIDVLGKNGEDAIYYLDPPYFLTKQYDAVFSDEQHLRMLKMLREAKYKWVFSCKAAITNYNVAMKGRKGKNEDTNKLIKYEVKGKPLYIPKLFEEEVKAEEKEKGQKKAKNKKTLDEYFRLFLYPQKEDDKVIKADTSNPGNRTNHQLYVYYPKNLRDESWEIMISNIAIKEGKEAELDKHGFEVEDFETFFWGKKVEELP